MIRTAQSAPTPTQTTPELRQPQDERDTRSRPRWLMRYTYTERLLHWINSAAFLALAATGLFLYFPSLNASGNRALGHLPGVLARVRLDGFHILAAIVFVLNPILWLLLGNRRALLADAREILHFDADDRAWLMRVFARRREAIPQGRFNAGQKLSAIGLVAAWVGFIVTGLMHMNWPPFNLNAGSLIDIPPGAGGPRPPNPGFGIPGFGPPGVGSPGFGGPGLGGPPARATGPFGLFHFSVTGLRAVDTAHELLALTCVIWLALHIYLATLHPSTRHSLRGMVTGKVRRDWALEHHAKWVARSEKPESP